MNVSAQELKLPIPQLAMAAGAIGLFFGIQSFAGFESVNLSSMTLRGFRLGESRSSFVDPSVVEMPIPEVNYKVMYPFGTRPEKVEAWLEGEGGARLSLDRSTWSAESFSFTRRGYSRTLRAPRLIVRYAGEVVLDQAVPPMLPALRAIPLIVPIASDVSLRQLSKDRQGTEAAPGPRDYRIIGTDARATPGTDLRFRRTEWAPRLGERFRKDPKGGWLASVANAVDVGGFVELTTGVTRRENSVREADLEVEIYRDGGETKIRILQELTIWFDRGGWLNAPAQTRALPTNGQGDVRRTVPFSFRDVIPLPPLFLLSAKDRNSGNGAVTGPALSATATIGEPWVVPKRPYQVELISPSIGDLGLRKLTLGPYELTDATKGTLKPLALGRHRLKLRVTLTDDYSLDRQRFVAVGP